MNWIFNFLFRIQILSKQAFNIAFEGGYFFPIPWNHVSQELWVNFPCLANVIFSYRIGDKFYSKKNYKKYGLEKLPNKKVIIERMKKNKI